MFASGKWKELADNTPTACFLLRISYSLSSELHILSFFMTVTLWFYKFKIYNSAYLFKDDACSKLKSNEHLTTYLYLE